MKKIAVDKQILYKCYIVENHTKEECAALLNVSVSTISRNIKKYNLIKDKESVYLKVRQNNFKKYGVENIASLPEVQQKIKETYLEKYGVDNIAKSATAKEKAQNTCMLRYGYKYSACNEYIKQKTKNTCLAKYGTDYAIKSIVVRDKIKNTFLNKYKTTAPIGTNQVQKKIKETNLKKYGVENQFQRSDFRYRAWKRYLYQGVSFDSSWELALWIYAKDHNEKIIREPIQYCYLVNGKKHYYTPDFLYKNKLIEIKGSHLIDKNGELIDLYGNMGPELAMTKMQCIKKHGVEIYSYAEMQPILSYIENTYGKKYLKKFKKKPTK